MCRSRRHNIADDTRPGSNVISHENVLMTEHHGGGRRHFGAASQ